MLEVYVDGAASGNPGPSGAGVVIKNKLIYHTGQFFLGDLTNHEAEWYAVIKALEICQKTYPDQIISIRTDSKLVVDMIERQFTKNPLYQPLLQEILTLMDVFPFCFIKWIPDQQNKAADKLARNAIFTKQTIVT
ncbi:ribonuclease HI [Natronobacillus azotifigens]|uniref:Ribonuclease HI family protein n=1 Tax=Natronobacillus azotifigens TaxID=472978 RepID=A0A9J6R8E7_9BACI|nr:ribonuclease HI family protein [Natronobacillus azotifigens]MCZ0701901.1 ribonuclease HI family protein [Natronobacillus azotifigens]